MILKLAHAMTEFDPDRPSWVHEPPERTFIWRPIFRHGCNC
jgi:hypothetical protein